MVLGVGGFGTVYKGWVEEKTMLPSKHGTGMMVAVKKLNHESVQGFQKWQLTISSSSISDSSCDANTPSSRKRHGSSNQTKRSSQAGWTDHEDNLLTDVVKKYNGRNWKKIAERIPGRTDVQCLHRWQKVLNPEIVKGPWTKEEDDHIIKMVDSHGCMKWSVIAKDLPGRIGKQCCERSSDKERSMESTKGINSHISPPDLRTDSAIKNRWNCSLKKKLDLNIYFIKDVS
ncbi:hypothetical protein L1887_36088 [Cichorium endivia]|nr:hypothetical protein L1887_36088 [Cichorium endivia]